MVSGNTVEYDLKGLQPATEYTLSVHALKDTQRSETLSTHFTTGATPPVPTAAIPSGPTCSVFLWCFFLPETCSLLVFASTFPRWEPGLADQRWFSVSSSADSHTEMEQELFPEGWEWQGWRGWKCS